jgi:hypothetical protein
MKTLILLSLCLTGPALADCTDITLPTDLDVSTEIEVIPEIGLSNFWFYPMHNMDFNDDSLFVAFERLEGPVDWTYQFCGINDGHEFCRPITSWETGFEIGLSFASEAEFEFDAEFIARSFGVGVVDITLSRQLCPEEVLHQILSFEVTEGSAVAQRPESLQLSQNFPNPFNPDTQIPFFLDAPSRVRVEIRDLRGALVATPLAGSNLVAGQHNLHFSASHLPSGTYIYSVITDIGRSEAKMTLVK